MAGTAAAQHAPSGAGLAALDERITATLDRIPVGAWHRRVITVVALGSFFNFFEVALGSLLIPLLPPPWTTTTVAKSMLIGATFAGELVGAVFLSLLADRLGRRRMFQVNLLAYAALSLAAATADTAPMLLVCRLLLGIGLGAELALVDTYLAELMPAAHRGRLIAWSYALGMLAIPIAGVLAARLPHTPAGIASWRWLMAAAAMGAVGVWTLRRRLPESPRWLAAQGRDGEALAVLAGINAAADHAHPDTGAGPEPAARPGVRVDHAPVPVPPGLLSRPLRRRTLLVGIIQTLGPIGFYGFASIDPLVLLHKGFTVVDSLSYSALTAFGYPVGSLLLVPLAERVQRRTLVIATSLLVAIAGCAFGMSDRVPVIVAAGTCTTLLSVIQATAARTYGAELFPTSVRNTAVGRTYALSRLVSVILPFVGLTVLDRFGSTTLYLCCATLLIALAVSVAALGPLTNAVPLESV